MKYWNLNIKTIVIAFLGFIFLLLLSYNGIVANEYKYKTEGDAWDYIHLGLSLAKTGKYGHFKETKKQILEDFKQEDIYNKDYIFHSSTAFRPPVWPLIIAGIFVISGYNLTYVLIFKYLLHILGVIIFYKTLRFLKLRETVIIAGTFLYAISPAWQLYSRVFLSEPITLFLITLWIYLLIRYIKNRKGFILQALVGGFLILSHPYYIFLPFSIWLVLYLSKEVKLKMFLASALICASVVSVWIIRNMIVLNTNNIVLTTSSGAVMAKGWNPKVTEEHTNTKGDLADEGLVLEDYEVDKVKNFSEVERMQLYKNATLDFIRSNPDMILPIIEKKLLSAFNPFPETPKPGVLETGRWLFQFLALVSLIYILIFSRNKLIKSLVIGLILSTIGITILTYSGFRFRMPQVGLEMLFITFVIDDLLKRINWRSSNLALRSGAARE